MKINSHNEWDELKEIIVGSAESMACLIFSSEKPVSDKTIETAYELARQAYPQNLLDEINEDLDELCDVLKDFGAKIHRPNISDVNKIYSSPNWTAAGNNMYNMRDLHLIVGNTVIESPTHERHRYFEATGLYDVWMKYFKEDAFRWINAPKPRLVGDYKIQFTVNGEIQTSSTGFPLTRLAEEEILFEAANTVRMGKDLLYLVSSSGNYLGAKWLQTILGDEYRVHTTSKIYRSSHIDSTVLALRPGLVLLNGYRVNPENCPKILNQWEQIIFNDILPYHKETIDFQNNVRSKIHKQLAELGVESNINDMSSEWIGMNVLSLDPETVVADKRQVNLIEALETHKLNVIPINFRHSGLISGGLHCCTLDTVRKSKLESYFD